MLTHARTEVVAEHQSELNFVSELLPKPHLTRTQQFVGLVGLAMGTAVVYAEFTLGVGFGDKVADNTKANSDARQLLKYFFALGSMIPAAALIGVPTQDKLISLAESHSVKKLARKNKHPYIKKGVIICGHLAVCLTGAPFVYILVEEFPDNLPIQIFWTVITLVTSYLCVSESVLFDIEMLFNTYAEEIDEIKRLQSNLLSKLENILEVVYRTNDDEILKLFSLISNNTPEDFLQELKKLSEINAVNPANFQPGVGKKVLDRLAFATGIAATYALYALTETASEWVCNAIGIENEYDKKGISHTIAFISTIPNTLFLADFTKKKCDDFYYSYYDKNFRINSETSRARFRKFLNWSSLVIGCLAAVGTTYLAIDNATKPGLNAFIPFSFLGSALAQSKTMDMLLQRGVNYYDFKFYPDSAFTQRDLIIKVLSTLKDEILYKLDLKDLTALDQFFSRDIEIPVVNNKLLGTSQLLAQQGIFKIAEAKNDMSSVEQEASTPSRVIWHSASPSKS